jgi:hypothetical protein
MPTFSRLICGFFLWNRQNCISSIFFSVAASRESHQKATVLSGPPTSAGSMARQPAHETSRLLHFGALYTERPTSCFLTVNKCIHSIRLLSSCVSVSY